MGLATSNTGGKMTKDDILEDQQKRYENMLSEIANDAKEIANEIQYKTKQKNFTVSKPFLSNLFRESKFYIMKFDFSYGVRIDRKKDQYYETHVPTKYKINVYKVFCEELRKLLPNIYKINHRMGFGGYSEELTIWLVIK